MEVQELGKSTFTHLKFDLLSGETIVTESGAMASMQSGVTMTTGFKGGFLKALIRKLLGGESLFFNTFKNVSRSPQHVVISKPTPGDVICRELKGETIYLQSGAYLCSTQGIDLDLSWAGFSHFFGGEGLFRLSASGHGKVWIGVFGALVEKELRGELIVDTGHLVAYPPNVSYKIQLSGGLINSFLSKEGLVGRLEGNGKVWLQTRSLGGLVSWLNPQLPRS